MENKRQGKVVFSEYEPGRGLAHALKVGRSDTLDTVRDSGMKGRGGAGFPTGVKWDLAATASGEKYVVCNADEGEPGTFKDRILLTENARQVFEGMVIAAFAIGAKKGFVYLRGEYKSFMPGLEKVLEEMKKDGQLGVHIMGNEDLNFDIEIRLGAGAYVCGEETALIESLEGNRGESRNRPPFPVNTGYAGHPTVVNNVETFATVTQILKNGAKWFKSFGTGKSPGTKVLSISSDCKNPGVYEVEFGTSVKDILKMVGGENAKAVQVGGASGTCVPKAQFGRKIAFEDLSTGGSVMVFNSKRGLLGIVENFLEFFEKESCGQCTPCREGIPVLLEGIRMIKAGECGPQNLKDLFSLAETMQLASKCGLGQSAPNAFVSVLDNFKNEYKISKVNKEETAFKG